MKKQDWAKALDYAVVAVLLLITVMMFANLIGLTNDAPTQSDPPRHRNRKPADQSRGRELQGVCPQFDVPARLLVQHPDTRRFVEVTDTNAIADVLTWGGDTNWQGYERGGWIIAPDDVYTMIYAYPADYDEAANPWGFQLIIVYTNAAYPGIALPMAFANLEPYADANGEHFGTHPCYAWQMTIADVNAWIVGAGRPG